MLQSFKQYCCFADEVRTMFNLTKPKIAFCQSESYEIYSQAAKDLELDTKIVGFGGGECTFSEFMNTYATNEPEENFK